MRSQKTGVFILGGISVIFLILGICIYFFPSDISNPHSYGKIMSVFCENENNTIVKRDQRGERGERDDGKNDEKDDGKNDKNDWCIYDILPQNFHECTLYRSGNTQEFNVSQLVQIEEEKEGKCILYVPDEISKQAAYILLGVGIGFGIVAGICACWNIKKPEYGTIQDIL